MQIERNSKGEIVGFRDGDVLYVMPESEQQTVNEVFGKGGFKNDVYAEHAIVNNEYFAELSAKGRMKEVQATFFGNPEGPNWVKERFVGGFGPGMKSDRITITKHGIEEGGGVTLTKTRQLYGRAWRYGNKPRLAWHADVKMWLFNDASFERIQRLPGVERTQYIDCERNFNIRNGKC